MFSVLQIFDNNTHTINCSLLFTVHVRWCYTWGSCALWAVAPTPWGTGGGTCPPLLQMAAGHGGTV